MLQFELFISKPVITLSFLGDGFLRSKQDQDHAMCMGLQDSKGKNLVEVRHPKGKALFVTDISKGMAAATADAVTLHFRQFEELYRLPSSDVSQACIEHLQVRLSNSCSVTRGVQDWQGLESAW